MSRVFDFTLAGVITIIASVVHLMAVELMAPGSVLWDVATDGTQNVNGVANASLWFQIIAVWVPLGVSGAIMLWALIREYRRQVQTAVSQRP